MEFKKTIHHDCFISSWHSCQAHSGRCRRNIHPDQLVQAFGSYYQSDIVFFYTTIIIYSKLCSCIFIFGAQCNFQSSSARLPCCLHSIAGGRQHWADPAWVRNLRQPGRPETWPPLQHQHLRCEGQPGERACFFPGQHWGVSSTRYRLLNSTESNTQYILTRMIMYLLFSWSCSLDKD